VCVCCIKNIRKSIITNEYKIYIRTKALFLFKEKSLLFKNTMNRYLKENESLQEYLEYD